MNTREIADLAREIRIQILYTIKGAGMGHIGGDFSVTDILATLFGAVLKVDPKDVRGAIDKFREALQESCYTDVERHIYRKQNLLF
jgi:transketolase N-terminal domain/subunit